MEKEINEFYIELAFFFNKDISYDVFKSYVNLEGEFTPLNKSLGQKKSAKFFVKTKMFRETFPDERFSEFVDSTSKEMKNVTELLKEYDGELWYVIVYNSVESKVYSTLSSELIKKLASMNANYDVDYTY